MERTQKKSLRRHLLFIYVGYFLALAIGFIHSFVPNVSSSWSAGWNAATEDIQMQEKHGIDQQTFFMTVRLKEPVSENLLSSKTQHAIETRYASVTAEAEYTSVNLYVKTSDKSDPELVRQLKKANYSLLLFIPALLAKLAILILVALIINILRKSVRDEQPLPKRIITYTRIIAALLILSEICTALGAYIYHHAAQILLEGTALQVDATFPLNYWNIFMAILVLFSAEVFSIGSQLSEEQKLTI